jgi:sugar phosphate permease
MSADVSKALLPLDGAKDEATTRKAWSVIGVLALGYIGIYLCRKNLGVALPLLQATFHASKAEVGKIASVGTFAYAMGKLLSGPIVDRLGGRRGFLLSMVLVSIFGVAGALVPGLFWLTIFYGLNRLAGAAGWGAAVKLVPTWFGVVRTATIISVLSLSYVAGGVLATPDRDPRRRLARRHGRPVGIPPSRSRRVRLVRASRPVSLLAAIGGRRR